MEIRDADIDPDTSEVLLGLVWVVKDAVPHVAEPTDARRESEKELAVEEGAFDVLHVFFLIRPSLPGDGALIVTPPSSFTRRRLRARDAAV